MSDDQPKTNAMRYLESQDIDYTPLYFSEEIHSAEGVAETLQMDPSQVFKTLVVMPANTTRPRPILAIVPGDRELNLKTLASATGEKKLRMATQREAESETGLLVGGISALALLQKSWKVYLDESASNYREIAISAGQRGVNLLIDVKDLVRLTQARVCDITG